MNGKTNRALLAGIGLAVVLVVTSFGSLGYVALSDSAHGAGSSEARFAAAAQTLDPTPTPVGVSSQGGGQVGVLPSEGSAPPTPVPTDPVGKLLPQSGRGPDVTMFVVLGLVGAGAIVLIIAGLWLRRGRRQDPTR